MEGEFDNKLIFGKYKVLKKIGRGSFGFVYKGKNIINDENIAIKVEDWRLKGDALEAEAYFLYYIKGFGIPEVKSFGVHGRYKVLIQTLLGNSIEKEFQLRNNKFELKDICMIAIQLIDRLEYIHSKYIIHRDIKTDNILTDEETKKIIYLIDFGLAKKYRSARTGRHIKFTIPRRLTGTARYASTNALRGTEQSRRDDLESLGYVLIYLAKNGFLPWQGLPIADRLERYKEIYKLKKYTKPEKLCERIPYEFCEYLKYTKNLQFEEKPDYDYLRGLFLNALNTKDLKNDLNFSWISIKDKVKNNEYQHSRNSSISKRKRSPYSRILRNIQNSREKEKNLEKINQNNLSIEIENKAEKRDNNFLVKRKKEKLKNQMELNDEEKKDIDKHLDKAISKSNILLNENHIETHSDNLGTQITLYNLSMNMDDIDNNLNYFELKDNKFKNELQLAKNKTIKLTNNNNNNDDKRNHKKNILGNRPIVFDIINGSFNDAQILKCLSEKNIKTDFIDIEKICNLNRNRTSMQVPIFDKNFFENKMKKNNKNKNSKNKNMINNSTNINSNNINNIKIKNNISIDNENRNKNKKRNINIYNNYIKFHDYINNNQKRINSQKIIKLNETNPNYSISLDNIKKSKSLDNNRRHYISPIHNLKNKNIGMNSDKYIKKIILEKKNNNTNNNNINKNIKIIKDTKEENKNKINYYKFYNENVMNGIKNKVSNGEYQLRDKFNIQKKLSISNDEIKSNSLKKQKSPQIKNSNYFNLYNSKSQGHSGNKKYNLKNDLYDIGNLNNKNFNFTKYNNNIINNSVNLNKYKIIHFSKKNSMLVNENKLKRIRISQFEGDFSKNKKRKIYNSPINNKTNNQIIKRNIYNNNNNVLNNSSISPTNNNFNFNIINNKIINTNANIQRKLIYQNKNNFSPENLNNKINITISGNRNECKRIFNFKKQF